MSRRVVLIGGGHAHIEVIRCWAADPPERASLTILDPNPKPIYSGMVPGYIAGQYDRASLEIDLERLCERAGGSYVRASVSAIDAEERRLERSDGAVSDYDIASMDIGSTVAGRELPGVAELSLPTRPIADFLDRADRLLERSLGAAVEPDPILVVGGGAGGVEIAFCLESRLRGRSGAPVKVELLTRNRDLLAGAAGSAIAAVERQASKRGIRVHRGCRVVELREDSLLLDDGRRLAAGAVIWVTGPAAHPLARESRLPTDERGFVRIESTLQVVGNEDLFAVGDCASLEGMKKAGVYAVRSGPLLDGNIRARLAGGPLRNYMPQHDFLSLLNVGDGQAIGTKWGVTLKGRPIMWLKDRIDRAFMRKYR